MKVESEQTHTKKQKIGTMQEEENLKGKKTQTIVSSIRKIIENKLHVKSKIRMLHKRRSAENKKNFRN